MKQPYFIGVNTVLGDISHFCDSLYPNENIHPDIRVPCTFLVDGENLEQKEIIERYFPAIHKPLLDQFFRISIAEIDTYLNEAFLLPNRLRAGIPADIIVIRPFVQHIKALYNEFIGKNPTDDTTSERFFKSLSIDDQEKIVKYFNNFDNFKANE